MVFLMIHSELHCKVLVFWTRLISDLGRVRGGWILVVGFWRMLRLGLLLRARKKGTRAQLLSRLSQIPKE